MFNIHRLKTITYVDFSAMHNVSFFSPIQIYLESSVVWLLNFVFDIYHKKLSVKGLRAATQRPQKLPTNFSIETLTPLPKEQDIDGKL